MMFLQLLGLLTALPIVNALLLESLGHRAGSPVVAALLLAAWVRIRAARRDGWSGLRLKYVEAPAPAIHGLKIHGLNLMR